MSSNQPRPDYRRVTLTFDAPVDLDIECHVIRAASQETNSKAGTDDARSAVLAKVIEEHLRSIDWQAGPEYVAASIAEFLTRNGLIA